MPTKVALVRQAQKRFRLINKHVFDGKLPPIQIKFFKNSKKIDGTFVSFIPPAGSKPHIILYAEVSDEVLLHEMVHYYLYLQYLPAFKLSGQTPKNGRIFVRRYSHTKEFWKILRSCHCKYRLV